MDYQINNLRLGKTHAMRGLFGPFFLGAQLQHQFVQWNLLPQQCLHGQFPGDVVNFCGAVPIPCSDV
jgi:hypothetical protein